MYKRQGYSVVAYDIDIKYWKIFYELTLNPSFFKIWYFNLKQKETRRTSYCIICQTGGRVLTEIDGKRQGKVVQLTSSLSLPFYSIHAKDYGLTIGV